MARLAEDSDGEFPELAVIIGKHGRGVKLKATGENPENTSTRKAVQTQTVAWPTAGPQNAGFHISSGDIEGSAMDGENPKSKRRVLKKICDNSLLRPFDPQKEGTQSLTSSEISRLQSKILPTKPKLHAESKASGHSSVNSVSEDEESSLGDSTGLSDFIVNDSSTLEEDSTDAEFELRPPRSTRRLDRGRRSPRPDSPQEGQSKPINDSQPQRDMHTPPLNGKLFRVGDNWEDTLQISNNGSPGVNPKGRCFVTPPSSPQKIQKRLLSPKKGLRIPMTPYRPSMDAFWDPDVINEWNEEYSPRKTPKPQYRIGDDGLETGLPTFPSKKNELTRNLKTREAKKLFAMKKNYIAETFLRELDENITNGEVSNIASSTGGVKIIWSKKLNTTAGRANWKRETMRSTIIGADGKPETNTTYRHHASIELAEKVINDEERLLNVIAHEFCHLANFMVSGIRNNPHGKEFKTWAAKCSQQFGDRGIQVTTKHSYDIDYKYVWECTNCGTEFKRHSKSIDPSKHQCGSCKSKLVQIKPVPRANAIASDYQLFLKENMKKVKEQNHGSPQKQIMTMLGKMYQEHKASKFRNTVETLDGADVGGLREESPDDTQVDLVMRKLDFLDLASP
jgi:predicted SprT family Zn-dependent metalloprotease